jgi:hypothetical protein
VETGAALGAPPAGVRPRRGSVTTPPAAETDDVPWNGPRVELGYAHSVLPDLPRAAGTDGAGSVHAITFGGYAPILPQLRLGLLGEGGSRAYALGRDDLLLRGTLVAGWQGVGLLPHLAPFVVATGGLGVLIGQRFSTTLTSLVTSVGLELGLEVNPVRTLHLGAAFGHAITHVDGLRFGVWQVRVFIGL